MVDYFPVLERAVAALNPNTKDARRVLYDRARRAMVDGLRASDPTLSDTDLRTQTLALEEAIRRVELAHAPDVPESPAPPAPRRIVTPAAPAPSAAPVTAPEAASESTPPPGDGYEDRPPLADERNPWRLIAASLAGLGLILVGAGAYTMWPGKSASTPPTQRGSAVKRDDTETAGAAPYVYLRQPVYYRTTHPVGTVVVDKQQSFLYLVRPSLSALRYGIGVGPECATAAGLYQVVRKEEWPGLKTSAGKPATEEERNRNPFGARAIHLDKQGRVHGTNTPSSIGRPGSIGCFRLTNDDVIHLYERAPIDTRVVVIN